MSTLGVEVVVIQSDKVLLTLRSDVPFYCLPGGGVEDGETIAAAAVREVREETGLQVALRRLVGVYSRPDWARGGDHGVVFTAVPLSVRLRPLDGEVIEMDYFDPDALPENLFWWQRQRILDGMLGDTAVAYHQDVLWPFGDLRPLEVRTTYRNGQFSAAEKKAFHQEFKTPRIDKREI